MTETRFDELLRTLVDGGVSFVVVGGLAVGAWGVVRGTKDVDIVPAPEPENLRRLAEVAVGLGGRVQTSDALLGAPPSIAALLATGVRVLIETDLGKLDVVHGLVGVPSYAQLVPGAEAADILGVKVKVCSLADLRMMKTTAGRARDIADLEDLDAANED